MLECNAQRRRGSKLYDIRANKAEKRTEWNDDASVVENFLMLLRLFLAVQRASPEPKDVKVNEEWSIDSIRHESGSSQESSEGQ